MDRLSPGAVGVGTVVPRKALHRSVPLDASSGRDILESDGRIMFQAFTMDDIYGDVA
jgi:hypothetical protein